MKRLPISVKESLQISSYLITGASTLAGIWGYTVRDISDSISWWKWLLIILASFILLSVIVYFIIKACKKKEYHTQINGKPVTIKIGDIFDSSGWKVIPFNERFDTVVDDRIIAHGTLNGKMIDKYVPDIEQLQYAIENAKDDSSPYKPHESNGKLLYPLGRIIVYEDYLLLAFSHFDEQNRAHIGIGEYEHLLHKMWSEIRRVYAGKPITIPLLGAGITDITGIPEKNYTEFLKCILCTLRSSNFKPEEGITIVLTETVMGKIDLDRIREEFR